MIPFKTPSLVRKTWPKRIWKIPDAGKTIYLTFDDGPIPGLTEWVLDRLKEFNAKATFFCVGENVRKYPDVFKRIVAEGHTVGNHTQRHLNGAKTDTAIYIDDVNQCDESLAVHEITTPFFRPPYGRLKPGQQKYLEGKKVIMWDVLSQDYDQSLSSELILQKTISATESGSIVVFHDNVKAEANLRFVLPLYLKHVSEAGYKLEALG